MLGDPLALAKPLTLGPHPRHADDHGEFYCLEQRNWKQTEHEITRSLSIIVVQSTCGHPHIGAIDMTPSEVADSGKVIDIYEWRPKPKPGELPRPCVLTELPTPPETKTKRKVRLTELGLLAMLVSMCRNLNI